MNFDDVLLELDRINRELILEFVDTSLNQFIIATTEENNYNRIKDLERINL